MRGYVLKHKWYLFIQFAIILLAMFIFNESTGAELWCGTFNAVCITIAVSIVAGLYRSNWD